MRLIIEIRRMINMPNACSHKEHHILHEYKANHADYDLISIITIYLGEEQPPDEDWLIRFLRLLFKDTRTPAMRKKQLLKDEFDMDTTADIEEEMKTMCNLSTGIYEQGMERGIAQGMERGIAQGMERGIAQGMERGAENTRRETALSMLKEGLPVDMVARITNLSIEEIKTLHQKMPNLN